MLTKLSLTTFFFVFFISSYSNYTQACKYHRGSWLSSKLEAGRVSMDAASTKELKNTPLIDLSLPLMMRGKVNKGKNITVSYHYASEEYKPTIQLQVETSPGIVVERNKIKLTGKKGQHTYSLKFEKTGSYRLKVSAKDFNRQDVPPTSEVVYVNIYE